MSRVKNRLSQAAGVVMARARVRREAAGEAEVRVTGGAAADRDGGVGAQDGGRRRRAEWGAWRSRPNKPSKKHIHIESSRKSVCAQQF